MRFRNFISEFLHNRIVLISTHIVSDIEETADNILIMNEGVVLENHDMAYYQEKMKQNHQEGLEQYYLELTGRRLHASEHEI